MKVELILRFLIFKHLLFESRGTWNSCANWAHLAESFPLVSLKRASCSACIGDRHNNWAGFYFAATQTSTLVVLYSYSRIKWRKRYKKHSALRGRDEQYGKGESMLRSLGSSCAVALSHLRTQLGNCCNSWRIYSFLMLPQERYRRSSDSYNDGCEIFVAFFFWWGGCLHLQVIKWGWRWSSCCKGKWEMWKILPIGKGLIIIRAENVGKINIHIHTFWFLEVLNLI